MGRIAELNPTTKRSKNLLECFRKWPNTLDTSRLHLRQMFSIFEQRRNVEINDDTIEHETRTQNAQLLIKCSVIK